MDFIQGLNGIVIAFHEDGREVTTVGSLGSSTIFQTRPFCGANGVGASSGLAAVPTFSRVDHVDYILHARPFIVGNILHTYKLEDTVQIAPILQYPLRTIKPVGTVVRLSRCQLPFVGGKGNSHHQPLILSRQYPAPWQRSSALARIDRETETAEPGAKS